MKNQDGKSPLGWIVTIVISILVAGVIIAMLFAGNENVSKIIEQYKNNSNTVQTQSK